MLATVVMISILIVIASLETKNATNVEEHLLQIQQGKRKK